MIGHSAQIVAAANTAEAAISLQCVNCATHMGSLQSSNDAITCPNCNWQITRAHGIWKALLPDRADYFARFIRDYESIRMAEGRGSDDPRYYLQLPYRDISGRNQAQWAIRAQTFRYIEQRILPNLFANRTKLSILDLGAGNGWMSYRLMLRGHQPVAVDLLLNNQDGMGASVHYKDDLTRLFPRVQAELDRLPFTENQFDLAIFNASFHYSENYERTLAEALRCIRIDGAVIIADTAWYSSDKSGQEMLRERKADFTARHGIPSDAIQSLEFLTDERLHKLEESFGIQWQIDSPFYGLRWSLRPLKARVLGKREPSHFRIYTARKKR